MPNSDYTIKTMSRDELALAAEWAASEGWNPGLNDVDCYYSADPSGFLMGYLGDEPIASISAVRYGDSFGFLGFYIVKPAYRGRGYGIALWSAAMDYLKGCNVGLDGVVAQQENYRKSGFKLAYRNVRYEGRGGGGVPGHSDIVELGSLPFDRLEGYERPFFPADRSTFLRQWIKQPDSHALGVTRDGKLAGYAVMRACRTGHKVGPLYADSPAMADALLNSLKGRVGEGETIYLDVPEINPNAVALARSHGMDVVFETARMYTKEPPLLPLERVFGVTSFEIG